MKLSTEPACRPCSLRWSPAAIDVYVKSVNESQVNVMDASSKKLGTCTNLATPAQKPVNWVSQRPQFQGDIGAEGES